MITKWTEADMHQLQKCRDEAERLVSHHLFADRNDALLRQALEQMRLQAELIYNIKERKALQGE